MSADLTYGLERYRLSLGERGWAEEVAQFETAAADVVAARASYPGGEIIAVTHASQTTLAFQTETRELSCVVPGRDAPLETFVHLLNRLTLTDLEASGRVEVKRRSAGSVRTNFAAAHCDGVGLLQVFARSKIADALPLAAGKPTTHGEAWAVDDGAGQRSFLVATASAACRVGALADADQTVVADFVRDVDIVASER